MTSLALLRDQGFTAFEVLLNEGVLELRETLFQFPICAVASHID